jgi:hypothetical protein
MRVSDVSSWLHRARSGSAELKRLVEDAKSLPSDELARAILRTTPLGNGYRLVLMGRCPACGRPAQSRPIRTSGHLGDLLRRFVPDPRIHRCPTTARECPRPLVERLGRLDRW